MKSFNCFNIKSFEDLYEDYNLPEILATSQNYYAHLQKTKEPEKLAEHIKLVISYFISICNSNKCELVIDKIIIELINDFENKNTLGNYIKKIFLNVIIYHDFGKVNENFQIKRMKNESFTEINNGIRTTHSLLGSYLFIVNHFDEINKFNLKPNENCLLYGITLLFSYSILRHHSSFLSKPYNEINFEEDVLSLIQNYLQLYNFNIDEFFKVNVFKNKKIKSILDNFKRIDFDNDFCLYSLIKLNFSLLTASDYYATTHYMNSFGSVHNDFGVLDDQLKEKVLINIKNSISYNRDLFEKFDYYKNFNFNLLQNKSNYNLNILRQKMAVEVINNANKHYDNNLFYIESPTGGGKTNLSILAATTMLEKNDDINKIYYVFPFTTLITQTYKTLSDTLGFNSSEIIELHSKSGYNIKNVEEENKEGLYGSDKVNYIDNLFVNYPVCLLSHIKFFDILKTNEKENNYILHRLCNSIVIIDELQSYTPKEWDKIIYFIENYAKYFNIKFILMSATLPKLDNLSIRVTKNNFINLISNSKENYFRNPNFRDRVKLDFTLLEENNLTMDTLSKKVYEKSEEYNRFSGSVKTVIEFIFKKTAGEFYKLIKDSECFDDYEIFLLSGTILEPRRKEIINYLKYEKIENSKILLISTQVIEAGVDIDMDLGFKNKSIIDSEEQIAGRINRNVLKNDSTLYIFKHDEPFRIYKSDLRYQMTRNELNIENYKEILLNKDFDKLYDLVKNKINQINSTEMIENFDTYKAKFKNLDFYEIHKYFELINSKTESIFIPLEIPLKINGEKCLENVFSSNEVLFLKDHKIISENDIKVDGKKVWEMYENILNFKSDDFTLKKINLKIIQGIMSKYIFSTFTYSSTITELKQKADCEEKNGYLYLKDYQNIYDYKDGIKDSEFKFSVFL